MRRFLRRLLGRAPKEDGNATIEFVILFPLFIYVFSSAWDASLFTTRQAMLSGALDRTVRDLQLGNLGTPTQGQLKSHICNLAGVIPDCAARLSIELVRISKSTWNLPTGKVGCVDVSDPKLTPALTFQNGTSNDLMLITACAAARPLVPNIGLGLRMPKINGTKYYAIIAMSAFVVEPV